MVRGGVVGLFGRFGRDGPVVGDYCDVAGNPFAHGDAGGLAFGRASIGLRLLWLRRG